MENSASENAGGPSLSRVIAVSLLRYPCRHRAARRAGEDDRRQVLLDLAGIAYTSRNHLWRCAKPIVRFGVDNRRQQPPSNGTSN